MKRFLVLTFLISLFSLALIPVSAKPNTPEQSQLPIPQGACVRFRIPIQDFGFVIGLGGNSIDFAPTYVELLLENGVPGDFYEVTGWIFTDEAYIITSFGTTGFSGSAFEGLTGLIETIGGGSVELLSRNACSFNAYRDNAALAQTYLVPDVGYDVYQIFDGAGILSFRVSQEALAGASAGEVLGSNDAGNITFTYNGGGTCTVAYPYPDGKTNSATFICQGEITDWGRTPIESNFFLFPI
ncbi:MAG TPA: hypothetical protein PLZ51_22365 [Aggregatilineales bacterium]|nr:hypothetical protein [Aggregatilineales bacterium]